MTTNFPLGAYVPLEFTLLVDDEIRFREHAGTMGIAVRSCIVFPHYYCADWLPVLTNGRSAIPWVVPGFVLPGNIDRTKPGNHQNKHGFLFPPHWHSPTNSFHGLVRPATIGVYNVTVEAQFCTVKRGCADIISSLTTALQVTPDALCANHPVVAQLSALRRKRAGRRIVSLTSLMKKSSSTVSAVIIQPGGTALSLHQLPISFMYFDHTVLPGVAAHSKEGGTTTTTNSSSSSSSNHGIIKKGPGNLCVTFPLRKHEQCYIFRILSISLQRCHSHVQYYFSHALSSSSHPLIASSTRQLKKRMQST